MADLTLRSTLDHALRTHDRDAAVSICLQAVADGNVEVTDLYNLLAQMLVDMGAGWQQGTVEVWQEHLVTGVVRTIIEGCAIHVASMAPAQRHATVVLAAPIDEHHDLGLRMLADRFSLAGWRAHFLGADVPVAELVGAVQHLGADAVALTASTHFHRVGLKTYVATLASTCPDLRIWVGGPAFAHDHDGWRHEMVLDPHAIPAPGSQ